jgi:branched-subunit amino acid transport protein AzlD
MIFVVEGKIGRLLTAGWYKLFGKARAERIFKGFDKVMPFFVVGLLVVGILMALGKVAASSGIAAAGLMFAGAVLFGLLGLGEENKS